MLSGWDSARETLDYIVGSIVRELVLLGVSKSEDSHCCQDPRRRVCESSSFKIAFNASLTFAVGHIIVNLVDENSLVSNFDAVKRQN